MTERHSLHRRSLRAKLIPLTVLAAILPALLIGILLILQQSQLRENQAFARLSDLAELARDRVSDFESDTDAILGTLAGSWEFVTRNPVAENFTLSVILRGHNAFREFAILDSQGKPYIHLAEGTRALPNEWEAWLRRPEWRAIDGEPIVHGPFKGPDGFPNLTRAYPIRDTDGNVTSILVARVSLEVLSSVLADYRLGQSGYAYVVSSRGSLIAHPDENLVKRQPDLSSLPVVEAVARGDSSEELFSSPYNEKGIRQPYVAVFNKDAPFGWTVIAQQTRREALTFGTNRFLLIGLLTLALTIPFFLLSMRIVSGIVDPVNRLRRGARIIGEGNYDYRLDIRTGDEVEELAHEFNRMASQVRAARDDLIALNRIGQEISSRLHPEEIWQALSDGARELTGAERVIAVSIDGVSGSEMTLVATSGIDSSCETPSRDAARSFIDRIAREGAPLRITDLRKEPELESSLPRCRDEMAGTLWVPLLGKGRKPVGGMLLQHSTPDFFGTREEQLVLTLASEAAIGLENARLFQQLEEERFNLQSVVDSMAEGVLILDIQTRIIHANQLASEMLGVPAQDIVNRIGGLGSFAVREPGGRILLTEELPGVQAMKTGQLVFGREVVYTHPVYGERILSVSGAPLRGSEGKILGSVVTFRDVTEIKEAEQELRRALESERRATREVASIMNVVQALTSTLDLKERLYIAAESLAGAVGVQRCIILLVRNDHLVPVAFYGIRPEDEPLINLIPSRISDYKLESIVIEAINQPRPIIVSDVANDPRITTPMARLFGMRSLLLVPIIYQGNTIGLAFIDQPEQYHEFSDRETRLALAIASQSGSIIAESQLLEQTEERAKELDTLFNVSRAVVSVLELQKVLDTIVEQIQQVMRVDAVALLLIDEPTQEVELKAWRGLSEEHVARSRLRIGEGIAGRVAADGIPRASFNIQFDPEYRLREVVRAEGLRSMLAVPITVRQQVIGVINLFTKETREFSSEDITLVSTIASLAGTAIRNATVYERERRIAETLQTSLLPAELPQLPGFQLGYRYEPAAAEARVGGDFYDFFPLPDDRWGLMVGDVSGHGVGAAVNTALAKYALRAYAYEDPEPCVVMAKLNNAVARQMQMGTFITVLYGVLNPDTHELLATNSGHPFALHYSAERNECRSLETAGMAVGILENEEYTETTLKLEPGDALVLFTDGVTEAGPINNMLGMEGVLSLILEYHHLDAQEIAEVIYNRVLEISGGTTTDDVALLVLKAV